MGCATCCVCTSTAVPSGWRTCAATHRTARLRCPGVQAGVPVRHDHIWARDLDVVDVRYPYEEAVAAGSDHALVVADVEV